MRTDQRNRLIRPVHAPGDRIPLVHLFAPNRNGRLQRLLNLHNGAKKTLYIDSRQWVRLSIGLWSHEGEHTPPRKGSVSLGSRIPLDL